MKIWHGLLIILLFQAVQQINGAFWSGNIWSTVVHGASFLATEIKEVARISANKAKNILKSTGWFNSEPTEECNEEWIRESTYILERQLNEFLYGQHLVTSHFSQAINHHLRPHRKDKPLVMSLHGSTGVGKNYVTKLLVENMFKLGEKSDFYTLYSGRVDFNEEKHKERYKERLKEDLVEKVSLCNRHVFIFDEVDKIPMGVLDVLKTFIDYNMKVRGIDFRKTLFIFISNMGQNEINTHYLNIWQDGTKRENMKYSDFERVLRDAVYNDKGGLRYSDNIKSHLIDLYIPFLPLEKEHVKRCIKFCFKDLHNMSPTDKEIEDVHQYVDYGPDHNPILAKTGCKSLNLKVAMVANLRRRKRDL